MLRHKSKTAVDMTSIPYRCEALAHALVLSASMLLVVGGHAEMIDDDVDALVALKLSLGSPPALDSWTGRDPCSRAWLGVTCGSAVSSDPRWTGSSEMSTAVGIYLRGMELQGTISPVVGQLLSLQFLDLAQNKLEGSIPSTLGNCTNLATLNLEDNRLDGTIPPELGYLEKLTTLNLSDNDLTGDIPDLLRTRSALLLSVDGNPLCGTNMTSICQGTGLQQSPSRGRAFRAGIAVSLVVLIVGLGVLLGGLGLFLLRRRQRLLMVKGGGGNVRHRGPHQKLTRDWGDAASVDGGGEGVGGGGGRRKGVAYASLEVNMQEIAEKTADFAEEYLLGFGSYGRTFRLDRTGGKIVVVKMLDNLPVGRFYDREFKQTVEALQRCSCAYLVKLVGCGSEKGRRALIYEHVDNGTLADHLYGSRRSSALDWATRVRIAARCALGLAYLQDGHGARPPIIHRDLRSNNILLDQKFNPKVSDFGLAQLCPEGAAGAGASARVLGAFGYMAPEFVKTGELSARSVVYTFGVILLELLTGRKPVDMKQPVGRQSLVSWVGPFLNNMELLRPLVDPVLKGSYPRTDLAKFAAVAAMCLQPEPNFRPLISDVAISLESLLEKLDPEVMVLQSAPLSSRGPSAVPPPPPRELRRSRSSDQLQQLDPIARISSLTRSYSHRMEPQDVEIGLRESMEGDVKMTHGQIR